jgi:phosphoribosylformylglycinamidine synthase subunit PurL
VSPAALHRELGLTDDEFDSIRARLGREPSYTELAMFSVMWSEHCSYKSSRVHLKNLPTTGPRILVGPGEGAGIVEVAPGVAVAWKIESHNHPSFVEPVNGAATGVGGIVRDILSMGARPIALMDSLRFGPLDDAHTRYLVDGVVNGISSYGNSIGVPTVGGETIFDDCYAENPLVNVACLGVVEHELMKGRADNPGDAVILIGSSTGRDGIGGASVLASAEFGEDSATKRPSVQVGDPLTEKLLIEASLELIRRGLVVGFQDLGAGGISCPTSEMAAKSGTGMNLSVDAVHRREPGMDPFEVMISESQERMLAVVAPERVHEVLSTCERWELTATIIGEVTSSERIEVRSEDRVVADIPAAALADEAPMYERASIRPDWIDELQSADAGSGAPDDLDAALLDVLGAPEICSKHWVWQQYDHMIFLGTVQGPGADAAVIRLPDRDDAVALSVDGPGRLCYLDPYRGAVAAVAEAARNVACTGARPVALTNCLNFGNPEKPEVMWQFAEAVRGIADAARALDTPVTGGNVSFYNETQGRPIYPTPVIGMLGALESARRSVGLGWTGDEDIIVLLGRTDPNDFAGSVFAAVYHGTIAGRPPAVDLGAERGLHEVLVAGADRGLLASAHDLSGGGIAVGLAEASIAGGRGFSFDLPDGEPHGALFSESPTRAVVSCAAGNLDELLELADSVGIVATVAGRTGGEMLDFGAVAIDLKAARARWEDSLASALSYTIDH